jgi:hypothetical protein
VQRPAVSLRSARPGTREGKRQEIRFAPVSLAATAEIKAQPAKTAANNGNAFVESAAEISKPEFIPSIESVDHPAHYNKHPSGVECIQIVEHMNFNVGNAMKYLWRAGEKGSALEDLQKAAWYLNREIGRLQGVRQCRKLRFLTMGI